MSGSNLIARYDAFTLLRTLDEDDLCRVLAALTGPEKRELDQRWARWAHRHQRPPANGDWRVWLMRAGRGFGKTRAGAEWVSAFARDHPGARIALVGATLTDGEGVMVQGLSGIMAVARADERPVWRAKLREVRFPSGAVATVYSAATPEALRGPEHDVAWCDELAKWRQGNVAWDNLQMTLRRGDASRVVVTTTPRPTALLRRIIDAPGTVEVVGRTADNPHLPADFRQRMEQLYGGTRLGRQELDGELLADHEGALWTRDLIERCRAERAPGAYRRVVVAVDPPASADGDACGIVCVALGEDGRGWVLADASVGGRSPGGWADAVVKCAEAWGADRVVAETNQGGDMVAHVLRGVAAALPVKPVHASRGKLARAEPVAALYEADRVRHLGAFPQLEDELCGLVTGGVYQGPGRSPDRADALVWALTELLLGPSVQPGVRQL